MSAVQQLLDALLWDIYGKASFRCLEDKRRILQVTSAQECDTNSWKYSTEMLERQSIHTLTEISASLRIEIRIIGSYLTRVLIGRDNLLRKQKALCCIITAYLKEFQSTAEARSMRFSLSPPQSNAESSGRTDGSTSSSDFDQWLHAMKMVARLPGGMPPEFRKKLWLALSEKYLQTRNVDWEKEQIKCFSEQWREDDEELGIQIVKDLHRTGSSLCSGPAGSINQAKLKRVLLGYARWNPEVGYCQNNWQDEVKAETISQQGFNMLGALILQVMDKNEVESMKVMIFLVEGVLPPGYFSGSLGGLQADMAVFREFMTSKLPKLAKHLQRLQGRNGEDSFEPPLTNVFTMQWFLTLFCTCLPINCVLRVWDLVLIEGSDVLLRTALAIWSILEDKILSAKTADDFYCKMGMLSGELLNGHLIDSNGLIEKVVDLGPVPELQKLRDKHLYNIAPWRDKKGLRLYYSDDEGDSDDDSRLAVTTAWGLRINRRGSSGLPSSSKPPIDNKDRIALDISLLKKQYDRLRERQRQAHIILTAAVARQAVNPTPSSSIQMNQLLMGRNAIVTNKGRRIGPPQGAIPPARKLSGPAKPTVAVTKQAKRGETLHWRDTEATKRRKSNIKLKEVDVSAYADASKTEPKPQSKVSTSTPPRSRKKSESSSYSEDSDANSSTSTSLCDEDENDNPDTCSSLEASPLRNVLSPKNEVPEEDKKLEDISKYIESLEDFPIDSNKEQDLDSTTIGQIPVIELTDPVDSLDPNKLNMVDTFNATVDEDSSTECDRFSKTAVSLNTTEFPVTSSNTEEQLLTLDNTLQKTDSSSASLRVSPDSPAEKTVDYLQVSKSALTITSTSQLSPIADISKYLSSSSISPLKSPTSFFGYTDLLSNDSNENVGPFDVSDEGVTNEYFERINLVERPTHLELFYSLNEDQGSDYEPMTKEPSTTPKSQQPEDEAKQVNEELTRSLQPTITPLTTDSLKTSSPTKNIVENQVICVDESLDQADAEIMSYSECRASSSFGSIFSHNISKEKSFSFDVSSTVEKQELRPTSCPEARESIVERNAQSDRVLKIIEENSLILHRILRKTVPITSPTHNKESLSKFTLHEESVPEQTIKSVPETPVEARSTEIGNTTFDYMTKSSIDLLRELKSVNDTTTQKKDAEDYSHSYSRLVDTSPIAIRSDDNIADRLASIKNTIKSIDSLCEEKDTYKRDRCQRYIDSLFSNTTTESSRTILSPPSIKISETDQILPITRSSLLDRTEKDSSPNHSARSFRKEVSPRRRKDEEREEYESRVRRDKMPKYLTDPEDSETTTAYKSIDLHGEHNQNTSKLGYDSDYGSLYKKFPDASDIYNKYDTSFTNRAITGTVFEIQSPSSTIYVPAKIELRHTTVTSTFYDRYLSQKQERIAKAEKSPQNGAHAYLDTLKPMLSNRNSKSAENSPSRKKEQTSPPYLASAKTNVNRPCCEELTVKSCDNILLRLKSSSSNTTTSSTYTTTPEKEKQPSDFSFRLGIYDGSRTYDSKS